MEKISFSKTTRRDWENVKDAVGDLRRDMGSPLFWIGLAIILFFIVAPLVLSEGELPW